LLNKIMASAKANRRRKRRRCWANFLFHIHRERKGKTKKDRARLFFARVVLSSGPRGEEAPSVRRSVIKPSAKTKPREVLTKRTLRRFPAGEVFDQAKSICRSLER